MQHKSFEAKWSYCTEERDTERSSHGISEGTGVPEGERKGDLFVTVIKHKKWRGFVFANQCGDSVVGERCDEENCQDATNEKDGQKVGNVCGVGLGGGGVSFLGTGSRPTTRESEK